MFKLSANPVCIKGFPTNGTIINASKAWNENGINHFNIDCKEESFIKELKNLLDKYEITNINIEAYNKEILLRVQNLKIVCENASNKKSDFEINF